MSNEKLKSAQIEEYQKHLNDGIITEEEYNSRVKALYVNEGETVKKPTLWKKIVGIIMILVASFVALCSAVQFYNYFNNDPLAVALGYTHDPKSLALAITFLVVTILGYIFGIRLVVKGFSKKK